MIVSAGDFIGKYMKLHASTGYVVNLSSYKPAGVIGLGGFLLSTV